MRSFFLPPLFWLLEREQERMGRLLFSYGVYFVFFSFPFPTENAFLPFLTPPRRVRCITRPTLRQINLFLLLRWGDCFLALFFSRKNCNNTSTLLRPRFFSFFPAVEIEGIRPADGHRIPSPSTTRGRHHFPPLSFFFPQAKSPFRFPRLFAGPSSFANRRPLFSQELTQGGGEKRGKPRIISAAFSLGGEKDAILFSRIPPPFPWLHSESLFFSSRTFLPPRGGPDFFSTRRCFLFFTRKGPFHPPPPLFYHPRTITDFSNVLFLRW